MMQSETGIAIVGAIAERTARAAAMLLEVCTREYAESMFESDKMSDLLLVEQVVGECLTLDADIAREHYDAVLTIYLPWGFSV